MKYLRIETLGNHLLMIPQGGSRRRHACVWFNFHMYKKSLRKGEIYCAGLLGLSSVNFR